MGNYKLRLQVLAATWFICLAVVGCGGGAEPEAGDDSESASPAATASSSPSRSETPMPLSREVQPGDPPGEVAAGVVRSPAGFVPAITFRVPPGWFGAGDEQGWGIGKGVNLVEQRFESVAMQVEVLDMPLNEAVETFQRIEELAPGPPKTGRVGPHRTATFSVTFPGGRGLEELGTGGDINEYSDQQIFVDVAGRTVLLRTEVFEGEARDELLQVLRSLRFAAT